MLQVKLVIPIYYMTKFQGIFISQKMTLSGGEDDKQGPLTCVAIAAGNKCILLNRQLLSQRAFDVCEKTDRFGDLVIDRLASEALTLIHIKIVTGILP